jgi:hypothetical protein
MFFKWYHKIVVKYKYFRKSFSLEALEAAGSGSNLGFNYSDLEKQDKESFTEVVTWEWIVRLEISNQKIIVAAGQLGLTGGAPPIFVFFSQIHEKQVYKYFWKKICSKYSIRRWSFLFILFCNYPNSFFNKLSRMVLFLFCLKKIYLLKYHTVYFRFRNP